MWDDADEREREWRRRESSRRWEKRVCIIVYTAHSHSHSAHTYQLNNRRRRSTLRNNEKEKKEMSDSADFQATRVKVELVFCFGADGVLG